MVDEEICNDTKGHSKDCQMKARCVAIFTLDMQSTRSKNRLAVKITSNVGFIIRGFEDDFLETRGH